MSARWPKWADEPVTLVPHDIGWALAAAEEIARLQTVLAEFNISAIHHIGSTAVPGLPAKPILDVMANRDEMYLHRADESRASRRHRTDVSSQHTAVEDSLETVVEDSLETAVEDSLETAVEDSLETAVEDSLETAVEDSLETAVEDSLETALAQIGYHRVPPDLDARPWRTFYIKPRLQRRYAHLHLLSASHPRWQDALVFRDFLRIRPLERDAYAALKRRLAVRYEHDREAYSQAKAAHITAVVARARAGEYHGSQ